MARPHPPSIIPILTTPNRIPSSLPLLYHLPPHPSACGAMRARYKGPSGTGILEVADDATVQDLFEEVKAKTGIVAFTLKYGPPMAMKTLDTSRGAEIARSVGLHGETLTIVPDEQRVPSPVTLPPPSPSPPSASSTSERRPRTQSNENPEDVNVPWPEREGTLREFTCD